MNKSTKLKVGIVLSAIIAAAAYILDDIFYYSDMKMAELFVFPVAIVLIVIIAVFLVVPYFQKK
jgi:uncharacterized membrane protein YadS